MNWYLEPLRRSFDWQGRSSRKEYWLFYLLGSVTTGIFAIPVFIIAFADAAGFGSGGPTLLALLAWIAYALAIMLANVASAVRRLHDTDKSGWYQLLFLIPMAGFILWLIFMCTEGTRSDNQYGPNPLIAGANPPTSSPSLDRTPPSSFPLTQEGSVPNQLPTTEAPQKPEDPQVADLREKLANAEAALTEKTVAARQQERRNQLAEHIHALEEEIADAENDLVKLQNPDNNA